MVGGKISKETKEQGLQLGILLFLRWSWVSGEKGASTF